MRAAILVSLVLASTAVVVGCGSSSSSAGGIQVVATTTQVADFVRQVGGPRVHVHQVLRPNTDPHEYEPSTGDAKAIAESRIVFRSGGDVDDWLTKVLQNAGGSRAVVTLSDSVRTMKGPPSGDLDPHWWQDPRNAEIAAREIGTALHVDPSAYIAKLKRLDGAVARCMEKVPRDERKLVTTHDALAYYAARYGIDVIGAVIPSLSTAGQPSAGDTARLIETIRATGVKAVFAESSVNPKVEAAIASATGATVGKALWADTLGPAGSDGATYIQSIESNTRAMVDGFTGGAVSCRF
jgi:zinc/manganese transport system substrate-binding protein